MPLPSRVVAGWSFSLGTQQSHEPPHNRSSGSDSRPATISTMICLLRGLATIATPFGPNFDNLDLVSGRTANSILRRR